MTIRTHFEPRDGYLYVRAEGPYSLSGVKAAFAEVVAACRSQGFSRVLIDVRGVKGEVSISERHEIGSFMAGEPVRALGVAFLSTEEQVTPEGFLENVAVNRGANVRVTTDLNEALRFLAGG